MSNGIQDIESNLDNTPSEQQERDSKRFLEQVGERYVLNKSSGLYEPEPKYDHQESKQNSSGTDKKTPFHVIVSRDWWVIGISALTLILLTATVHYTRRQWLVMNSTLGEVQKQTGFAQTTARDATETLGKTEEFFRTDERSWVVISSIVKTETILPAPPFGTQFKFSIFLKNVGKTVARDVRVHVENPDASAIFLENQHAIRLSQDQQFRVMGTQKRSIMPDNPAPQTLAPGAETPVPIFSAGQEPKRYNDGGYRYTVILGRVDYVDSFGANHWIHFCYFVSNAKGELAHCKYGNDQDANPEINKR